MAVTLTGDFLRGRRGKEIGADDRAALEASLGPVRRLPRRTMLVRRGDRVNESTLLIDGFMCRYMDDREGRRQIVAFHVPGDFVDLHAYPLHALDHDVATITAVRVASAPRAAIDRILVERPHLTQLLWFSTLLDAAMHREWIFRIGRLGAIGRIAHLICEFNVRLRAVGLSDGRRYRLPITQIDIGEACGLTSIHVNRTLRQMREDGLVTVRTGAVEIEDWAALMRAAEFDPDYLFLSETGLCD